MFQCPHCNRVFKQKGSLDYHINKAKNKCYDKTIVILDGKKLFQCDMCESKFTRPTALKYHKESKHNINKQSLDLIELKKELKELKELNGITELTEIIKHLIANQQNITQNAQNIQIFKTLKILPKILPIMLYLTHSVKNQRSILMMKLGYFVLKNHWKAFLN